MLFSPVGVNVLPLSWRLVTCRNPLSTKWVASVNVTPEKSEVRMLSPVKAEPARPTAAGFNVNVGNAHELEQAAASATATRVRLNAGCLYNT